MNNKDKCINTFTRVFQDKMNKRCRFGCLFATSDKCQSLLVSIDAQWKSSTLSYKPFPTSIEVTTCQRISSIV